MRRSALCAIGSVCVFAACGEAVVTGPPATIHGAVVLQPETIGVGQLVNVALSVVTPPDHQIRPIELPESIPPLWLLDAERLPIRRDGERWLHTTRVRARVREAPGEYRWPEQVLEVEAPNGEIARVVLEAVPFVVVSASDALPDRLEPFGLLGSDGRSESGLPSRTDPSHSLVAALLGAAAALLAAASVRALRRRRRRQSDREEAKADAEPAWTRADADLQAALALLDADPHAAADTAASCLRRYVQRRSGRAVESLTTEEIAGQRPPGRLRTRWPEWVELLRRLDALRFPGHLETSGSRAQLRTVLEDARGFVERSIPPREFR